MKKILCLTDFSENAYNGILYANELAKKLSANLILMHTYQLDVDPLSEGSTLPSLIAHSDTESRDKLSAICMDLKREDKYSTTSYEYLIREGGVSKNLNKTIVEQGIELVVFSIEGDLSPNDSYYGSIVSQLVQTTKCSIIAVPKGIKFKKIENIVYAFDIENQNTFEKDILYFTKLVNAKLNILSYLSEEDEKKVEQIYAKFGQLKQDSGYTNIQLDIKSSENILSSLSEYIVDRNADLVVLENNKRTLYKRFLEGSFTRDFIFLSKIPVLVIRSNEE